MSENLTKADLVRIVAGKSGINMTQANRAIDATFQTIQEGMIAGKKFSMVGFGTFQVNVRQPRNGRNPQTGENMLIPGKLVAKFKSGKKLKQALDSIESVSKWVNK